MSEDVKQLTEVLDTVSKKVPDLIANIMKTIYSEQAAGEIGRAVGSLYKELVASGIPQDAALKMAQDYMISMKDFGKMFSNNGHSRHADQE